MPLYSPNRPGLGLFHLAGTKGANPKTGRHPRGTARLNLSDIRDTLLME